MKHSESGQVAAAILVVLLVVAFVVFIAAMILGPIFVTDEAAVNAMHAAGFSQVQITGKSIFLVDLFGCGGDDNIKFDVTAVNPSGVKVTNAYVCQGWPFKGATIRYH